MERKLDDDTHRATWIDHEREQDYERSHERFDRVAFALQAIDMLRPRGVRIAVAPARRHLRVDAGRMWGAPRPTTRWAVVTVPDDASRRSIALAVASLGRLEGAPYALDVLLGDDARSPEEPSR